MREFTSNYEQVKAYLPDERDAYELPKWWLANVFNTVIGEAFGKWVRERVETSTAERQADLNLYIDVAPGILEILGESKDLSSKYLAQFVPPSSPYHTYLLLTA